MNRSFTLFSCVCCVVLMIGCVGIVQAFDIAVYFDARSPVNTRCMDPDSLFCWPDRAPRHVVLGFLVNPLDGVDKCHLGCYIKLTCLLTKSFRYS
jgi:hypothetical protein